jgi:alpha-ketoglutaric semialdehyde dehydrogenase
MSTPLNGQQRIGNEQSADSTESFQGHNPATGESLATAFYEASEHEIDRALQLAACAFTTFRSTSPDQRAAFLDAIADEVEAIGDELLELAHSETGLPLPRLTGERGRATGQARQFAAWTRDGSWLDARIDLPQPDRQPLPKPDVRSLLTAIGPVVVFGASNFPLAISVIGADTVSAFAAGCPVVVKAHPAHPGTCELIADAVLRAAEKTNMPEGVFSMVQGKSNDTGLALVKHPNTSAVAFTGSLAGGRALADAAAAREIPIPVFAEMGSVNPVFILPGALAEAERAASLAAGYVQSVSLGVGQFCTSPGLVFGLQSDSLTNFVKNAAAAAATVAPATMLHAGIHSAFASGVAAIQDGEGISLAGASEESADPQKAQAATTIFEADSAALRDNPDLYEEVFGPVSTVIKCSEAAEFEEFARQLDGSLTATIHGTEEDLKNHATLIAILEEKVGRLIFNGFPTGIEPCHAMHHGGPYPAATNGRFTSIGTRSVDRFVRPVCYQAWPDAALPEELQNANPRGLMRLVDGALTRDALPA